MTDVTAIEDQLTQLEAATDRYDEAETTRKNLREALAKEMQDAWRAGISVEEIRAVTGFSRGHVYQMLGNAVPSHGEVRRARRKRVTPREDKP